MGTQVKEVNAREKEQQVIINNNNNNNNNNNSKRLHFQLKGKLAESIMIILFLTAPLSI